jgi:hypothetical protein
MKFFDLEKRVINFDEYMPASKRSNNQEKARNFQNFESEVR